MFFKVRMQNCKQGFQELKTYHSKAFCVIEQLLISILLKYHIRARSNNRKLTIKNSSISETNFITRMLFKDIY